MGPSSKTRVRARVLLPIVIAFATVIVGVLWLAMTSPLPRAREVVPVRDVANVNHRMQPGDSPQPTFRPPLSRPSSHTPTGEDGTSAYADDKSMMDGESIECVTMAGDERCSFFEPSARVLQYMVECGAIRYDLPRLVTNGTPLDKDPMREQFGLTHREIERASAAEQKFAEDFGAELREIYSVSTGVDTRDIEGRPLAQLMQEMQRIPADHHGIRTQLAKERAGHQPHARADPSMPAIERFYRLLVDGGDRYEMMLAEAIGRERASELRRARDGRAMFGFTLSGPCPSSAKTNE